MNLQNLSEDKIQIAIFEELRIRKVEFLSMEGNRITMASLFHHSPNGGERVSKISAKGRRYSPEGAKLERMGVKAGFPDIFIFAAKNGYHGLFVELKIYKANRDLEFIKNNIKPKGSLATDNQVSMISSLNHQGYLAVVAYGYDAGIKIIKDYLNETLQI